MERRKLALKDLDATVADARRLLEEGYQRTGEWDLAQVCGHSAFAINSSIDGFGSKPPLFIILMAKVMGMRKKIYATRTLKAGLPAPAISLVEPAHGDRDVESKAVDALATAVDRVKNFAGTLQPHPVFGSLSRDEWLEFLTIHTMHHLTFLVPAGAAGAAA